MKLFKQVSPSIVFWAAMSTASVAADNVTIRNGHGRTLALTGASGSSLKVVLTRKAASDGLPPPGEIFVSISTTHAVGVPKFHIYNRFGKTLMISGVAFHHGSLLSTFDLCGHDDTDSWTVLPAATTGVRLTRITQLATECP